MLPDTRAEEDLLDKSLQVYASIITEEEKLI